MIAKALILVTVLVISAAIPACTGGIPIQQPKTNVLTALAQNQNGKNNAAPNAAAPPVDQRPQQNGMAPVAATSKDTQQQPTNQQTSKDQDAQKNQQNPNVATPKGTPQPTPQPENKVTKKDQVVQNTQPNANVDTSKGNPQPSISRLPNKDQAEQNNGQQPNGLATMPPGTGTTNLRLGK